MSTTNDLTQQAKNDFLDRNRDLLALTRNGANDVFRRISASLALDPDAQAAAVMFYADVVDQPGYAGQVGRADFQRSMYQAICKAFLRCQANLVIEFVAAKLTPEALAQLEAIEVTAGVRQAPEPIAPPPPPLTAAEQLEAEVVSDYNGAITTDKMRKKFNSNVAYRDTFNRLSDAGKLQSQVTTLHDFSKVSVGS